MASAKQGKKIEVATKDDISELKQDLTTLQHQLSLVETGFTEATCRSCDALRSEFRDFMVGELSKLDVSFQQSRANVAANMAATSNLASQLEQIKVEQAIAMESLQCLQHCQHCLESDTKQGMHGMAELASKVEHGLEEVGKDLASSTELLRAYAQNEAQAVTMLMSSKLQGAVDELETRRAHQECEQRQVQQVAYDEGTRALEAAIETLDRRFNEELSTRDAKWREMVGAAVCGAEQGLRRELSEKAGLTALAASRDDLKRAEITWKQQAATIAAEMSRIRADAKTCLAELGRLEVRLCQTTKQPLATSSDVEEQLMAVRKDNQNRMAQVESCISNLRHMCSGLGSLLTCQVEWHIEFSTVLALGESSAPYASSTGPVVAKLLSPKFEIAGRCGLQLELQVHAAEEPLGSAPNLGHCSVYLWAPKGLQLAFRLFAGACSEVVRHTFDGTEPCGVARLFSLPELLEDEVDFLSVGIEIHEAAQEHTVESQMDGTCSDAFTGLLRVQQYRNYKALEHMMGQQRAMMELAEKRQDSLRSRSIRRVQWRLDRACALLPHFEEGMPICSTAFQAAGLDGMQLVFYPSGCAGSREGFCSLFLACPMDCRIRCWLRVGRHRREARKEAESLGLLGRINFARFDSCVDPQDGSVELALEIQEVQRDEHQGVSQMFAADARDCTCSENSVNAPSFNRVDRCKLSIQHKVGLGVTRDSVQDHVAQLPSIWTSHGFRTLEDLTIPKTERSLHGLISRGNTPSSIRTTPRLAVQRPSARCAADSLGHKYSVYGAL